MKTLTSRKNAFWNRFVRRKRSSASCVRRIGVCDVNDERSSMILQTHMIDSFAELRNDTYKNTNQKSRKHISTKKKFYAAGRYSSVGSTTFASI